MMLTMLQNNTLPIGYLYDDQYITSDDCGVFAIIVLTVSCNFVLFNHVSLYACCTSAGEHVCV